VPRELRLRFSGLLDLGDDLGSLSLNSGSFGRGALRQQCGTLGSTLTLAKLSSRQRGG
jgi:hypothetical protein